MYHARLLTLPVLAIALAVMLVEPAQSRIVCDGNYQIVNGSPISTPYCREKTIVQVARAYGIRVSLDAIRNSESTKQSVCAVIGYDNRVRDTCQPYVDGRGGLRIPF
jgi:hypothetical protein